MVDLIKLHGGITTLIPHWFNYAYDDGIDNNHILNGGSDMFDIGNKVNSFRMYFSGFKAFSNI